MTGFNREIDPPPALEAQVVAALRDRALIAPSRRSRVVGAVAMIAAGMVLFLAGYTVGASKTPARPAPEPPLPRFMLLLHDTPAIASIGIPEPQLVGEYRNWARSVAAGGTAIEGEKLRMEGDQTFSGFFIVAAPSRDAAEAIAASCPHARYGGRIEIREIDPT